MLKIVKDQLNYLEAMQNYHTEENSDVIDNYLCDYASRFDYSVLPHFAEFINRTESLFNVVNNEEVQEDFLDFKEKLEKLENEKDFFNWFNDELCNSSIDYFFNASIEHTGYCMPSMAFDCISLGEIECEISEQILQSPFKNGIFEHLEKNSNFVIVGNYAYLDLTCHCVVMRLDWESFLTKALEYFEEIN